MLFGSTRAWPSTSEKQRFIQGIMPNDLIRTSEVNLFAERPESFAALPCAWQLVPANR